MKLHLIMGNFDGMRSINAEILFKTAGSGGKVGQNVNKVETMVTGFWLVKKTNLFSDEEKIRLQEKLHSRINAEGFLFVKSQSERTQAGNKTLVIKKMNELVKKALIIPKKRKATKPTKEAKEKRMETKRKNAFQKQLRQKISAHE